MVFKLKSKILSSLVLLLIAEQRLGCKPEYTMTYRKGVHQKNIRQGRQLESLESNCKLRDPRRFLQALVVNAKLQPIGTGQGRQGRRHEDKNYRRLKKGKREERHRKGAETIGGRKKGKWNKKKLILMKRERRERKRKNSGATIGKKKRQGDTKIAGVKRGEREKTIKRKSKKAKEGYGLKKKWGVKSRKGAQEREKDGKARGQGEKRMGRTGLLPRQPVCVEIQGDPLGFEPPNFIDLFADIVDEESDIEDDDEVQFGPLVLEFHTTTTTTTTTTTITTTTTTTTTSTTTTNTETTVPPNGNQHNMRKCTTNGNIGTIPAKIKRLRDRIVKSLNSAFTGSGLATSACAQCSPVDVLVAALCDQCKRISNGQKTSLQKNPTTEDINLFNSTSSITYFSQASYGPTLADYEKCKYPDCNSISKSVVIGGVSHVVDLPEKLQPWEQAFAYSQLSHDVFPGQTGPNREIQYNMQPPRPCSSTTKRVLVNMVPVCQDGDCRSEDPCAGKGKSSFDWSRPLSYGYGSNYFVEDTTGGGFMI